MPSAMESLLFFAMLVAALVDALGRLDDRRRDPDLAGYYVDLDRYPRSWPR